MKPIHSLYLLAAAAVCAPSANAEIMLNEVMQSNVYTIMDDINEFPDAWVELYNPGSEAVDIAGYYLGQKDDIQKCDVLRSAVIPAGGHLLIYCDKADVGLHTSFRLDSGKGTVYLFDPQGNKIDEVSLKKMPAPDIAYGRKTDGSDKWGYMLTATPGAPNAGGQGKDVLGDVVFSYEGGVWKDTQPFDLELYLPDDAPEDAVIIYTTNGREPAVGSSQVYTNPIYISTSKVVRAKVVCDGYLSRPSSCQSYIFLGRNMEIPVISIVVNHEYLYDTNIGIFAKGTQGGWHNENYFYDWRRPINLEFFTAENEDAALNQLCEMRVQGGYTRENPLKSLAVYANKRFGTKRFEYEFWEKDKPGITDNKSIILRNGGNDFAGAYVRDALCQRVLGRNTNTVDWQGYSPAIIYLNGQYHGMLAIRERSSEDNIYSNYGGLEDIDMFENWDEIKAGDREAREVFNDFMYGQHTLEEWAAMIDLDSYCDMMALNYWIYNTDFPHNNIVFWRRRAGDDLRWRWLIKDCDFGLGLYNSNENTGRNFSDFLNAGDGVAYDMWRNLMAVPGFKDYLADRMIARQGDFLNSATFIEYLDELLAENYGELRISHNKWSNNWWANLDYNWQFIRDWCHQRERNMPALMKKTFDLGALIDMSVNAALSQDETGGLHLRYCGTPLSRGVFSGNEYVGRTITLEGAPEDNIVAWEVKAGNAAVERVEGPCLTLEIKNKASYKINAVIDASGITDVEADTIGAVRVDGDTVTASGEITVFDVAGRAVATGVGSVTVPQPGIYVVKTATATVKVAI